MFDYANQQGQRNNLVLMSWCFDEVKEKPTYIYNAVKMEKAGFSAFIQVRISNKHNDNFDLYLSLKLRQPSFM